MRDCRRPVAKDPGLNVHGSCFGVSYGHIYYPLQAFTFITCEEETQTQGQSKDTLNERLPKTCSNSGIQDRNFTACLNNKPSLHMDHLML